MQKPVLRTQVLLEVIRDNGAEAETMIIKWAYRDIFRGTLRRKIYAVAVELGRWPELETIEW